MTVLLPYQQHLIETVASHDVTVCEKSRRIGMTWAIAADGVLRAAATRGSDVLYVGYNRDMTREFIDTCAMWAQSLGHAAGAVEEYLFREQDEKGADRAIQAFRITFASGFVIDALCSRPRSLRGRQGFVIIDEAAFHDDLGELLKAALALLMWGGKVLVISTHDGVDNAFAQLLDEVRAGKRPYAVVRVTFEDALAAGLYHRICETQGKAWSRDDEVAWATGIRELYGEDAAEELDCVPKASGGKYIARSVLEARTTDAPVLTFSCDDQFVDLSDDERYGRTARWLNETVLPVLRERAVGGRSYLGEDFGRSGDLSVQWPLIVMPNLDRVTPFVLELRNVPFRQQEQILFAVCDALPQFSGGALDARGNGQFLAEFARQRYGSDTIAEVMLSESWYREHMPPMRAALEDATLTLPRSAAVVDDFRAIEVVNGVARVVERTKGKDGRRHGDSAIACALALFASRTLDGGPVWVAGSGNNVSRGAFAGLPEVSAKNLVGWN